MTVRILEPTLINQIAAGEVIERPASVIKELVENAIDAGATRVEITVRDGGKTYMAVTDNGRGMPASDLALAVERHATSKIPDNDLFNIHTLGFRGEALPSIGSISRLCIQSCSQGQDTGWQVSVEGGVKTTVQPASLIDGTRIEVRDLFFAVPARLKFLKSNSYELQTIKDCLNRLALSHPNIHFLLYDNTHKVFDYPPSEHRIQDVLGDEFASNLCKVSACEGELSLEGVISLPTYNRGNAREQYFFVNQRHIKDKILATAVRLAYQDCLVAYRYPSVVLFLKISPEDFDVNVHPTKAEVRFRHSHSVSDFVLRALKEALSTQGQQTATTLSHDIVAKFKPMAYRPSSAASYFLPKPSQPILRMDPPQPSFELAETSKEIDLEVPSSQDHPLGIARAQVYRAYILAETSNDLIIVDQHAAHERLVYEQLKNQVLSGAPQRQILLIPEVVPLAEREATLLKEYAEVFLKAGLLLEAFGQQACVVREIPVALGQINVKQFILDLVQALEDTETTQFVQDRLCEILAYQGCRNSIQAGRHLSLEEMNALLRRMEQTPLSGQCNHGRPTYISLGRLDIEKLFGRR